MQPGLVILIVNRRDYHWFETLRQHLKIYSDRDTFRTWEQTRDIPPGEKIDDAVEKAFSGAQAIVLLVSADFLATEFTPKTTLSNQIGAAAGHVPIFWVPLSACSHDATEVREYTPLWDPKQPIDTLDKSRVAKAFTEICEKIKQALTAKTAVHYQGRGTDDDARRSELPSDKWTQATLQGRLWETIDDRERIRWQKSVRGIVESCRTVWDKNSMIGDPWRDEELAMRISQNIANLALQAKPGLELTPPEIAALSIVPFIYEAALAAGAYFMADGHPQEVEPEHEFINNPRRALEREHQTRVPLVHKAKRLREQDHAGDYRALMMWMMHTCVTRDPRLWTHAPLGRFPEGVVMAIEAARRSGAPQAAIFTWARVEELARYVFADPDRVTRGGIATEERIAGVGRIRTRMLGLLVCLASWMAMDVRKFPELLVEHLGLSDPITPQDVLEALRRMRWGSVEDGGGTAVLHAECRHPAIDYGLREGVERADVCLARIRERASRPESGLDELLGLPVRLTAEQVVPAHEGLTYELPHVRLELAHDEIKALLMGEALYGDPALAIRELYQNALDACRYRAAREKCIEQTGNGVRVDESWTGRIDFKQDVGPGGRPYVECVDNGVGMEITDIVGCFARAGRKFHEMPEFVDEQADWQSLKPPIELFPNSQFGIGVFSYFMLADEIEVETCRFRRDGTRGPSILVTIAGSGSLFRIVRRPAEKAGTRIRLYLNSTNVRGEYGREEPLVCAKILRRFLRVAEFLTSCTSAEGEPVLWIPDALQTDDDKYHRRGQSVHPLVKGRLWCSNVPAVLADGLVTNSQAYEFLVVNLCKEQRPRLTVDRKSVLSHDERWIAEQIESCWEEIKKWTGLSMQALWWLRKTFPDTATKLIDSLIREQAEILWDESGTRFRVRIDKIQFHPEDEQIMQWAQDPDDDLGDVPEQERRDHDHGRRQRPMLPLGMILDRVRIWVDAGAKVDLRLIAELSKHPVRSDSPLLGPDGNLIAAAIKRFGERSQFELKHMIGVPEMYAMHLVWLAFEQKRSICDVHDALQRYASFGVACPKLISTQLARVDFVPSAGDLVLLSEDAESKEPRRMPEFQVFEFLFIAMRLGFTIPVMLERLSLYAVFGVKPPRLDSERLVALLQLVKEHRGLFEGLWKRQRSGGYVGGLLLLRLSQESGRTVREVGMLLRRVNVLREQYPSLSDEIPAEDELNEMEQCFYRSPEPGSALCALVVSQGQFHELEVAHRFGTLTGKWGRRCAKQALIQVRVDDVDLRILETLLQINRYGRSEDVVLPEDIRYVAQCLNLPHLQIIERINRFAPLGITLKVGWLWWWRLVS